MTAVQRWIDADLESHDIDRDAVKLIQRLLDTIKPKTSTVKAVSPQRYKDDPGSRSDWTNLDGDQTNNTPKR